MTKPRQLVATVGPMHGGVEFLAGASAGIEGYAIGQMTKSHRGKLYIDDSSWGPEADSIEYGYGSPSARSMSSSVSSVGQPPGWMPFPTPSQPAAPIPDRQNLARREPAGCMPLWV